MTAKPAGKAKTASSAKPGKALTSAPQAGKATVKSKRQPIKAAATKRPAGKTTVEAMVAAKPVKQKTGASLAGRNKTIDKMMSILCRTYPDAHCELQFASTFQLLTAVIMSAQTTDVGVNKVTPILFKKYPDALALASADIEDIKQIIRPTGYFNAKAKNIQRCAQALVERFNGVVPGTLDELTSLPGVGRKTANVVLGVAFAKPGWTVDTHVQRLVRRLGFTNETDPVKIEFALQKVFPNQDWSKYSITLIWHGRRLCYARNPACKECPINGLCPSSQSSVATHA